jgi:ubiquinone/menaquinone biosynthesis C-methylase UbiE
MDRILEPERMEVPERAEAYARTEFSDVNASFVARLLELAGPASPRRAVDLGTGPGDVPLRLAVRRPGWQIAAVDASMPMLSHARASARPDTARVAFCSADAKRLPVGDGIFDIVFSNSLLHHLPDPLSFWREIGRVAKPGALVFVRDLLRPPTPEVALRLVDTYASDGHPLLREDFYNSFLAAFTLGEIRDQLAATGLALSVKQVTDRHVDVVGHV